MIGPEQTDQFKDAITDERGSLVDECLVSARVLALGIPEKDEMGTLSDGVNVQMGI